MGVRSASVIVILAVLSYSCNSYKATVKSSDQLHYDALRVEPAWELKPNRGKKWIVPVIAMATGGYYGYNNAITYPDGTTYSGGEHAFILTAAGLGVGWVVNAILFSNKKLKKQGFQLSQSDKWLKKFNNEIKSDYTLLKRDLNNTLVIAPGKNVESLRLEFRNLIKELEKDQPSITLAQLEEWKAKLERDYSFMPSGETGELLNAIANNSQKIANNDLIRLINDLNTLQAEYASLARLADFKENNPQIYTAADLTTRKKADDLMQVRLKSILEEVVQKKIGGINSLRDITSVNQAIGEFDNKYKRYSWNPIIGKAYSALSEKKLGILQSSAAAIRSEINQATTIEQVKTLETKYSSYVDESHSLVVQLKNSAGERRKELFYETERKRTIEDKIEFSIGTERNEELEEKASLGEASVFRKIGLRFYLGYYVKQDYPEAFKWLKKSAEKGNVLSMRLVGEMYAEGRGISKNKFEAFKWHRDAAEKGDITSINYIASAYDKGEGTIEDQSEAFKWNKILAEKGNEGAMMVIATRYSMGKGVPQSDNEALKWYRKAADKGLPLAMFVIAQNYRNGRGVPQSDTEAFKWYLKAAEKGEKLAIKNVALFYGTGEGTQKNIVESSKWYLKAAENGDVDAMFTIARKYCLGEGVEENQTRCFKWALEAAKNGHVDGMHLAAESYRLGEGTTENNVEAFKWYKKSAEKGHTRSMYFTGLLYLTGSGVQVNFNSARYWLQKAANEGDEEIRIDALDALKIVNR